MEGARSLCLEHVGKIDGQTGHSNPTCSAPPILIPPHRSPCTLSTPPALSLYSRDLHFLNTSAFSASRLHFSPHTLATAVDGVAALPPAGLLALVVGDETTTARSVPGVKGLRPFIKGFDRRSQPLTNPVSNLALAEHSLRSMVLTQYGAVGCIPTLSVSCPIFAQMHKTILVGESRYNDAQRESNCGWPSSHSLYDSDKRPLIAYVIQTSVQQSTGCS